MGYHASVSTDFGGLTEHDATQRLRVGPIWNQAAAAPQVPDAAQASDAPICGSVQRSGRTISFTLETAHLAPEMPRFMVEQAIMAALLAVSFIAPIFHLLG